MDGHGPSSTLQSKVSETDMNSLTPQEKMSKHFTFNVDDRNSEEYYLEHDF